VSPVRDTIDDRKRPSDELPTGSAPRVLVILLNWNHANDTIECLESLSYLRYPSFTTMVCDNGSTEGGLDVVETWAKARSLDYQSLDRTSAEQGGGPDAREPGLILVQTGANLGFAGGNNVAIRYALARTGYDCVWLLNNDTTVDPNALVHMTSAMALDPTLGAVGSTIYRYDRPTRMENLGGGPFNRWFGIDWPYPPKRRFVSDILAVEHLLGASMLVRLATIREVGLMDERYFLYREETDWCLRMRAAGWGLSSALRSTVWHKIGASVNHKSAIHDYYSTRNMLFLVQRFYPKALPSAYTYTFVRAMIPKLLRAELRRIPHVWRAFVDFQRGTRGRVALDRRDRDDPDF
jgi:GT2 family glycosyltransferase